MAICKNCGSQFTWGSLDDRWVPLILSGEEGNLPRTHVDADGVLRSLHHVVCTGHSAATKITKLATPVPANHVLITDSVIMTEPKRKRKKKE